MLNEQINCSCGATACLDVDHSCTNSMTETGQTEYRHQIRWTARCRECKLSLSMTTVEHTNSNTPRIPFKRWVEIGKETWETYLDAMVEGS